ncbi:MAG: molybdopterin cofactor-binding domain-containing protein [Bacteroidia bacterium]|nr:molybdopterin cofactor-binding domain-containing protein [Bacteroidia bacterium]
MSNIKTSYNRRSFLKASALAGGGLVISFNFLASCTPEEVEEKLVLPKEWYDFNSYLKIGDNGVVSIYSPNPEFGQNVKTSMPMIVAEELEVDWKNVIVEQAAYSPEQFPGSPFGQFTGGSRGIMMKWKPLRIAGATAKQMLKEAAAKAWQVPVGEITAQAGLLEHKASQKSAGYGEMASAAAQIPVPEEVDLKEPKDYSIIGHSKKNVDGKKIVTGKPLFGVDYQKEGMLIAMIEQPPAFGMTLSSIENADKLKSMPGIVDVFPLKTYKDGFKRGFFDTNAFAELVAIVGNSTWEVMQAKKKLEVSWKPLPDKTLTMSRFGRDFKVNVPGGLENTVEHNARMSELMDKPGKIVREDGDPDAMFKKAARIIERTYTAPYLAHNCMEPMNFFADVKENQVHVAGPLQGPGLIESAIADRLGIAEENIEIEMTRMGGGFGRRAYSHHVVEAAVISQRVNAPVKLIYSREDDMTNGVYRPTYQARYRAALDENNQLLAMHVKAGGVPESPLFANRFPAGSLDHYKAEEFSIDSNITTGAFRAPRSNFMAGAEQSFLDEIAEEMGKDPIEFRLELLNRAAENPVGERNDYDAERYAGVLKLVRDKSAWGNKDENLHRGVSAYFCHNSYAAHVLDLKLVDGEPSVQKVTCAIDCGIVINPDAAANMAEGGITDGIGNAFFGEMSFINGIPQKNNFHQYRMIRMEEAPKEIEVHFVDSDVDPTGLGEPPFPPIFGAVANAMYKATGERQYNQPFLGEKLDLTKE